MDDIADNIPALDISDQQALEILRALRPLFSLYSNLSHDINNPLTGIIGCGEFLSETPEELSDTQLKQVKQILECAERIEKITWKLCKVKMDIIQDSAFGKLIEKYLEVKNSNQLIEFSK